MLNKKAIAALAAGATLVSGLAFATPSFAAEGPKQETCKVDTKKVAELNRKVNVAQGKVYEAEDALNKAQEDNNKAQEKANNAASLADAYKNAAKAYIDAKDAETGAADPAAAALKTAQANVALVAAIKAANDAKLNLGVYADAAALYAKKSEPATSADNYVKKVDNTVTPLTTAAAGTQNKVYTAQGELNAAKAKLANLEKDLAKAECKTTPAPAPQPGPQPGPQNPVTLPTVVADPTTKDEAINATRLAAMVLQNAENDLAKKNHDYNDVKAAYEKVIRELSVAKANLEKAQHDLDAFLASGVDDSAKETRLTDLRDRAQAHVTRLAAEFTALTLKYNDAKTAAVNAGAAFKAAKAQYKKIYNEAIALGVNPALLPVVATSDPLMPNFADPAGAKELYAEAVSGKFGDAVAAAAKKGQKEAKKGEAKKGASAAAPAGAKLDTKAAAAASAAPLSKTGVTVMFTALAASMLAGIGAAVRKFRH